ncbi:MAG TPA: acyl carrier protein [Gemmatimonadota bacterium]|nr:acyl carrier protein [Gemmatimonadota bacterium]
MDGHSRESIRRRIAAYVVDNFLYMRPDLDLEPETSLLDTGILDSMGVVEVVEFLSDEFGMSVPGEEITRSNFGSVEAMAEYVEGKIEEARDAA